MLNIKEAPNKIAVAQMAVKDSDIVHNIARHLLIVQQAARLGVGCLAFPELSLTGYVLTHLQSLAISLDDARLAPLLEAAVTNKICFGVGAPIKINGQIFIGLLLFQPTGKIDYYCKMHLHSGEEYFVRAGEAHFSHVINGIHVAHAICADTSDATHAQIMADAGADVYMAGMLITAGGYTSDSYQLSQYSRQHKMLVAMANHTVSTGGWQPIGKSALWFNGEQIAIANETSDALVVGQRTASGWQGNVVYLSEGLALKAF